MGLGRGRLAAGGQLSCRCSCGTTWDAAWPARACCWWPCTGRGRCWAMFASVPIARFGSQRTYALGLAGLAVLVAVMIVTPGPGVVHRRGPLRRPGAGVALVGLPDLCHASGAGGAAWSGVVAGELHGGGGARRRRAGAGRAGQCVRVSRLCAGRRADYRRGGAGRAHAAAGRAGGAARRRNQDPRAAATDAGAGDSDPGLHPRLHHRHVRRLHNPGRAESWWTPAAT